MFIVHVVLKVYWWEKVTVNLKTSDQGNLTQGLTAAAHRRFNRIRQVTPMWPHPVHPNQHLRHTGSAPCWVAFGISTVEHVWAGRFLPLKLPAHVCGSGLHLIHGSLGPFKSTSQIASRSVNPFLQASQSLQTDRQTDRPRYSICSNRLHLASAVMWPNNMTK